MRVRDVELTLDDVLGGLLLFALLVLGLWIGAGLGFGSGSDELLQVVPQ